METSVLPVDAARIGKMVAIPRAGDVLDDFEIELNPASQDAKHLQRAAEQLQHSDIPVAFPTETVYGLGADATRSSAVLGIYQAKQRPADNPLIVHFASLHQLRTLLDPSYSEEWPKTDRINNGGPMKDPIPEIYRPVISKFWPGPLTIILPNPTNSLLCTEVTAGLRTFGARIPKHAIALALIKLANVPVAAPSANASTKPSPTAAEHVAYDLDGRIETILDSGPCDVGVESTVVDGLCDPPLILRPGGISIEQLKTCPGWENTQIGYKNVSESNSQPKAPGMKYRHYSPKATVVLYEAGNKPPTISELVRYLGEYKKLGVITTKQWAVNETNTSGVIELRAQVKLNGTPKSAPTNEVGFAGMFKSVNLSFSTKEALVRHHINCENDSLEISALSLGSETAGIARGIFSALRELDRENVDAIFVEGIDESEGDTAAAVMNRLRKAAEVKINV